MTNDRKLSQTISTDPSFGTFVAIAREVEVCGRDLALPEERFEFWSKHLWTRFPRGEFPLLYDELEFLAATLADQEYAAATQLFALGTLGLSEIGVEQHINHPRFRTARARKLRMLANNLAKTSLLPRFRPAKVAKGQSAASAGSAPTADHEVIAVGPRANRRRG
ncbi:hypothetical protein ACFL6C_13115 [Myxococcota bacterium]